MSLFESVSGCTGNIAGIHLQNAHYFKAVRAVGASPKTMRAAETEGRGQQRGSAGTCGCFW